eukprot:6397338-Alexandrium_andersonii.AAC.1
MCIRDRVTPPRTSTCSSLAPRAHAAHAGLSLQPPRPVDTMRSCRLHARVPLFAALLHHARAQRAHGLSC